MNESQNNILRKIQMLSFSKLLVTQNLCYRARILQIATDVEIK